MYKYFGLKTLRKEEDLGEVEMIILKCILKKRCERRGFVNFA
jgi:hypothetical protein